MPTFHCYQGNPHTHTIGGVCEGENRYEEHGYEFLVLTDHRELGGVAALKTEKGNAFPCGDIFRTMFRLCGPRS